MEKFFQLQKYDDRSGTVYGIMTAEEPDKGGEIFDYDGGGKADVLRWSEECAASTRAAGQEISLGNIRLQHDASKIAGKVVRLDYDDNAKRIGLLSEPANDEMRDLVRRGFVRGYSIAGDYQSRNCNECGADMMGEGNICPECGRRVLVKFVPRIVECSYVDNPCVGSATFEFVRADGSSVQKKFTEVKPMKQHLQRLAEHCDSEAKCHKSLSSNHAAMAKICESRGDFESSKIHKSCADAHGEIARKATQRAEQWSTEASQAPDTWPLSGWTVGSDGKPVGGPDKVAKNFFDEFYRRRPEAPFVPMPDPSKLFR